jgi:hypothetical protein
VKPVVDDSTNYKLARQTVKGSQADAGKRILKLMSQLIA